MNKTEIILYDKDHERHEAEVVLRRIMKELKITAGRFEDFAYAVGVVHEHLNKFNKEIKQHNNNMKNKTY